MTAHTVLNVDDTAANRYIKSRTLRLAGFHVVEAATGQSALEIAGREHPDVVLLDIKLPDISGLDVCRRLKSDASTRRIPVIHISATFTGNEMKETSEEVGADIYLAEPVGPNELTSAVQTVIKLRSTERSLAETLERMRLATEAAGIGTWDIDATGRVLWSPQIYAMTGYDPSIKPSLETWLSRVRADEREAAAHAIEQAFRQGSSFAIEQWIERADNGEARCIASYATYRPAERGSPPRMIGVAMDVTERKEIEMERERLLDQTRAGLEAAQEAARMKDEFLAILSHELRTPMSAVLGWLHLLRGGLLDPEKQKEALGIIERNARLQVQLVNDLLDVSRMVTGKLELEEEVVALESTIAHAVETLRPSASAREIEVRARIEPGRWTVRGSSARLAQVFGNLLSNAVKFSAEGKAIEVDLAGQGEHVSVSVRDEGPGIEAEMLPRIFDLFRQGDSTTRRKHGGLGLGLAIARSIVELHGGHITVTSRVGHGATFTVTLPLSRGKAAAEGVLPEPSEAPLRGCRVLLVDDDTDNLDMTAILLRDEGAIVVTAAGSSQALDAAPECAPDVLVLDVAMPDMDGYELLARLRESLGRSAATLPAVALTGLASPSDVSRALAAGFQAHLAKPFEPQELHRAIARLTRREARAGGYAGDPSRP